MTSPLGKKMPDGRWMGPNTAKRSLIYFLADLRILTPEQAAEILVTYKLKTNTIRETAEQIKFLLK